MVCNPVWEICEHVAEVQALLDDHLAGGKHSAADVVAKAQAVLSAAELLRAMFVVGYFPPNTAPAQ
jgi:2-keto-4-pentenoate hydratase